MRLSHLITAGIAIAAFMLAVKPHLVLKVPKIGFILFSFVGGEIPPYFDGRIFDYDRLWLQPNDVLLPVCTKCGTTWMMATVHSIRTKGDSTKSYRDIYEEVRWAEFVYYPGQTLEERIAILKKQRQKYDFAAFKTHKQPPTVRVRDDVKYIVGIRSPLDVAGSLRAFFPNHDVAFATMWGGFPVEAGKVLGPEDEKIYEHMFLVDIGNGRPMLDVLDLDLVRGWWPYRHRKNVLFVHYADRIRDHKGEIMRMADFMGVNLTIGELDAVTEETSFKSMKRESSKYDMRYLFEEYRETGLVPKDLDSPVRDLVNVGPSRSGEDELNSNFLQKVKEKVIKDMGPEIAEYLFNGGHNLPNVDL